VRQVHDLAIVGGGINGCGIARDAAGRGLSVFLCEAGDLGEGTSSRSTKLIHGGLRYLEHFDFRLVREALREREVLWGIAPHIVQPLRFVLPVERGMRPAWMLRIGLFLYDHLGARTALPGTAELDLTSDPAGTPLKGGRFGTAFEYSDCRVDDARLVVLNARDAADRGATIAVRARAVAAKRADGLWHLAIERQGAGQEVIAARVLVNAAGPWVEEVVRGFRGVAAPAPLRLVQGSHIVVRKLFTHDRAYLLQNPDGRVVFAIPYEREFTLIGTTDRDFTGDPDHAAPTQEEIDYLCAAASAAFRHAVRRDDVVWAYAGVRPLLGGGEIEAKAVSRDYTFELDAAGAPLLSVIGGKITTYRRLAEAALERLAAHLPVRQGLSPGWTAQHPLPGGDFGAADLVPLVERFSREHPFLAAAHAERLIHAYGTRAPHVLGGAKSAADLGRHFGASLWEAEVRYLAEEEWARTAEDVAWRRSKLGLWMARQEMAALEAFMATLVPSAT
jgi:glycerol-3-phosphate dehydrogenase